MSLTKRIRPFISTGLEQSLAPDAVTLRARLYFIGTLIYYSVTVCLVIKCVSGSVQDDALDHCYVPGYVPVPLLSFSGWPASRYIWITLRNIKTQREYY
ncbi:hypothetical protein K438DRAFT_1970038 [Mycena galopus ATCC 62051]|nr:hypothetical protein K438DRAFT_1970038 [Mycena galopus ATCC 62051]